MRCITYILLGIILTGIGMPWVASASGFATASIEEIQCTGENVIWLETAYGGIGPEISAEDAVAYGSMVKIFVGFNVPVEANVTVKLLNQTKTKFIKPDIYGKSKDTFYFRIPENTSLKEIPFYVVADVQSIVCNGTHIKRTLKLNSTNKFTILECSKEELQSLEQQKEGILEQLKNARLLLINGEATLDNELVNTYTKIKEYLNKYEEYAVDKKRCETGKYFLNLAIKETDNLNKIIENQKRTKTGILIVGVGVVLIVFITISMVRKR